MATATHVSVRVMAWTFHILLLVWLWPLFCDSQPFSSGKAGCGTISLAQVVDGLWVRKFSFPSWAGQTLSYPIQYSGECCLLTSTSSKLCMVLKIASGKVKWEGIPLPQAECVPVPCFIQEMIFCHHWSAWYCDHIGTMDNMSNYGSEESRFNTWLAQLSFILSNIMDKGVGHGFSTSLLCCQFGHGL